MVSIEVGDSLCPQRLVGLMHYLYLLIAIVSEVAATTALKSAEGFTRVLPSAVVVVGYSAAFYFLSLCLQRLSIGVAYAIWAGVGIVLIAILGAVVHGQRLDLPAVVGMLLIVTGVVVINAFSATQVH